MTTTKKKAASRRRATPATTLAALQTVVAQLRDMSADDAVMLRHLTAGLDEGQNTRRDTNITSISTVRRPVLPLEDIVARWTKMLRISQACRRVQGNPDQGYFYLSAMACISVAELRWPDDPATVAIWAKIDAIQEREGIDDCWLIGEGPADYQALDRQSSDRYDQLVIDTMLAMGEPDMAALYRDDRDTFDQCFEAGRTVTQFRIRTA